jgi:hypothetical protein
MIERYDMATKITKYVRNTKALTFSELGLLDYMLSNADSEGHIQRDLNTMARDGDSTPSSVHRWQQELIRKGAVEVVTKSRTGRHGHRTPPVLKPLKPRTAMGLAFGRNVELAQVIDSAQPSLSHDIAEKPTMGKAEPIPRGMLTSNAVSGGSLCSVDGRCDVVGDLSQKTAVPDVEHPPTRINGETFVWNGDAYVPEVEVA